MLADGETFLARHSAHSARKDLLLSRLYRLDFCTSSAELNQINQTQRVKLVFLIRSLAIGGAERQLTELAKSLDPNRFDITVLCFYGGGQFANDLIKANIPVLSLDKKGRWDLAGFGARLIKYLRYLKPDILHSYMTGSNLVAALAKVALPKAKIVWGVEAAYVDHKQYGWLEQVTSRVEILLSFVPRLIIFNSFAGRDYHLLAGFSGSHAIVIQNGIDMARFSPDPIAGAQLRSDWNVPSDAFLIGLSGRLDPIKDHPTFLKAAALFSQHHSGARFVCIGDGHGDYLQRLQILAKELDLTNKVVWPGFVENMVGAYNALDLCCSASHSEGTSNTIAEAMACGIPCVATDVGDSRHIIGNTGILVPPRDPEAMAAGWIAMRHQICQQPQLSSLVRQRIQQRLSLTQLVNSTSDALLGTL